MEKTLDYRIALLVDGPNMVKADINDVTRKTEKYGRVMIKEAFLNKSTPEAVLDFYVYAGYQPVNNCIKDIDTSLAIRASELLCSPLYASIDMIALATQDVDYISLFQKSRFYDKRILVLGLNGDSQSSALKRNADYFEIVKGR